MSERIVIRNVDFEILKSYVNSLVEDLPENETQRKLANYLFDVCAENSFSYVEADEVDEAKETSPLPSASILDLIRNDLSSVKFGKRYIIYITTSKPNNVGSELFSGYEQNSTYKKISLIKLVREQYDWGLKESKELVDDIVKNVVNSPETRVTRLFTVSNLGDALSLFERIKSSGFSCAVYDRDYHRIVERCDF